MMKYRLGRKEADDLMELADAVTVLQVTLKIIESAGAKEWMKK